MIGFEITVSRGRIAALASGPELDGVVRAGLLAGMTRATLRVVAAVRAKKLAGQALKARTGALSRAVFSRVEDLREGALGVVGVDLKKAPYGRAHEFGATIRPVRARFLTIPLDAVLTGKGVARFTARDVIQAPEAHGFVGTFVAKHVIFGKLQGGGIVPLFALKEQVVLKPVGYVGGTLHGMRADIRADLRDGVAAALARAKKG